MTYLDVVTEAEALSILKALINVMLASILIVAALPY
jgi:hypothetical protein